MDALIAVDPIEPKGKSFELFGEAIQRFQKAGFITKSSVASAIHASLYSVPTKWYREMKDGLAQEAGSKIKSACKDQFKFDSVKVLKTDSSDNEDLVQELTRYGQRQDSDLFVVASSNRVGLPHWILGSFSETAALTSSLPVLIIKPHWKSVDYSKDPRMVLAVDASSPPSKKALQWIAKAAAGANAEVDLVYVEPKHRLIIDSVQNRKTKREASTIMKDIQKTLRAAGVSSKPHHLKENTSPSHTLANFANQRRAWMIVTIAAKRSFARKLLLGSASRRLLSLSERPFLSVRVES